MNLLFLTKGVLTIFRENNKKEPYPYFYLKKKRSFSILLKKKKDDFVTLKEVSTKLMEISCMH